MPSHTVQETDTKAKEPNYHYLALCKYQQMKAGRGRRCRGGRCPPLQYRRQTTRRKIQIIIIWLCVSISWWKLGQGGGVVVVDALPCIVQETDTKAKDPNSHYLTQCEYQLIKSGRGRRSWGGCVPVCLYSVWQSGACLLCVHYRPIVLLLNQFHSPIVDSSIGLSYRTPAYYAWRAGTTTLCHSWLYPPRQRLLNQHLHKMGNTKTTCPRGTSLDFL